MSQLSKSISNDPYIVVLTQGLKKTNHKVHCYPLPLLFRNEHSLKGTTILSMFIFDVLALLTFGYKIHNVTLHSSPPIILLKIYIHLSSTGMYRVLRVVMLYKNS